MNSTLLLRALIFASGCALFLFTTSAALVAQSGTIHACLNPIGTVRIVASSNDCRPGEAHITWGAQGEPGDTKVLTASVKGVSVSTSLSVPDFGTVDLSCDAAGDPATSITGAAAFQLRGGGGFIGSAGGTLNLLDSADFTSFLVTNANGAWKLEYMASGAFPPFSIPCVVAVTMTRL